MHKTGGRNKPRHFFHEFSEDGSRLFAQGNSLKREGLGAGPEDHRDRTRGNHHGGQLKSMDVSFQWAQGCSVSMYDRDEPSITRHVNLPVAYAPVSILMRFRLTSIS